MGILSNIFGKQDEYPPLSADSYANTRLEEVADQLKELIAETSERLEVIPSEHAAYVFIGKPPKKFGLAWIHEATSASGDDTYFNNGQHACYGWLTSSGDGGFTIDTTTADVSVGSCSASLPIACCAMAP